MFNKVKLSGQQVLLIVLVLGILGMNGSSVPVAEAQLVAIGTPIDGSLARPACADFKLDLGLADIDIDDPGWVWVNRALPGAPKFRSVTGVVTRSKVTHTDFPAVHDSHDQNTDILVDPGQEDILSDVGKDDPNDPRSPDTLELEWEMGTFPTETGKNAAERFFPKWAWPSVGDRVWANGHWIFDCGHAVEKSGKQHFRTEIHPARAIASMRQQVRTLPGTTLVPVTATDLYIHGRAGFIVDVLNCGQGIILSSNPDSCPTKSTPIDENFEFDIPMPPKPTPTAALVTFVEDGPANTIGISPILEPRPADNPTSVHVTIPLAGSGVTPDDVYARKIYIGWNVPPTTPLRHFRVTLNKMDLHDDKEADPGDCECTFFWMNVDRSPENEWIRLVDFAVPTDCGFFCTNTMNDYDSDEGFGNGELKFSGAVFDFFVLEGQSFTIRANGYDQDCLDDYFGNHSFQLRTFLDCYLASGLNAGDNDPFHSFEATFGPPDYGVGLQDITAGVEYELEFTIEELPVPTGEGPLAETSESGPALTTFNDRLYIAWAGTDGRLNVMSSSDGVNFSGKVTLSEFSFVAPALTLFQGRLTIAWTGTDGRLNIMSSSDGINFGDKVTLEETSNAAPALVTAALVDLPLPGRLYLGWTGTDGRLNVMSSLDGVNFESKVTLEDTSNVAPVLKDFTGRLYIAWTGTDGRLNVMSSSDGVNFGGKVTLGETSFAAPALEVFSSRFNIAWTGTDGRLNIMSSLDGVNFGDKATLAETSIAAPALSRFRSLVGGGYIAWTGTDKRLNVRFISR